MATKKQNVKEEPRRKKFTATEEMKLGALVQKYKKIVECKKTDSTNNKLL